MVSRRVRRSWYSFGIFVKSMGSTLSLNCATSTSPDFSQGKYPLHPSSLAALAASSADLAGLLDPADGFRARTAPTDTGEARHRVDRFFERRLATRDLRLAVGHVLEAEFDVRLAAPLVAEHLEPSPEPLVRRPLDVAHRDVAVATRRGLDPAPQRDHARR